MAALRENKLFLVNFTGADWCGACIRLRRNVSDAPSFGEYARESLVQPEHFFNDLPSLLDTLRSSRQGN